MQQVNAIADFSQKSGEWIDENFSRMTSESQKKEKKPDGEIKLPRNRNDPKTYHSNGRLDQYGCGDQQQPAILFG